MSQKKTEKSIIQIDHKFHLYSYIILIIESSGPGKTNSLFNAIHQQPDIEQAFIEYSNDMGDIYKKVDEYNSNKKCKILIVFDEMIAILTNRK